MIALLTVLFVGTGAFSPSAYKQGTRSRSLSMEFALGLPGADGPELKNFDPLKFSTNSPEWVPWFRESEIKHGRIAMLATAGIVATDFFRLGGDVFQTGTVIEAHNNAVKSGAMVQILFWVSLLEILTTPAAIGLFGSSDRKPGK